ncbi:zinc-dependent alcohol dehydrogenase [Algihabitans albus]|uniref:zinc-dependent alcohol dehydrogenase n=1 Tax=Algihabitans albus TaxID=2164067 RepID=UPI000E5D167C|nr:zinc-binding alcohol dehydrogenase [Algihabitans albus]
MTAARTVAQEALAFWITGPGRGALRAEPLPAPGTGQALVRALYSGISRGTEGLVFRGEVPESEYSRMRAPLQDGAFPFPVKYGYASVGQVEAGPAPLIGREVFCLHPHQDRYLAPLELLLPLPEQVPARRAVLGANMETALNALWDGAPCLGDRIAVIGAGVVGCLVARLAAAIPGTEVYLIDTDPAKAGLAAALDLPFLTPDAAGDRLADVCDLVVHATGSPEGLAPCLTLAGFEATILELSWYGTKPVSLPLGQDFHAKRLKLISSQVGSLSPARRARRSHSDRLAMALTLLRNPLFDSLLDGEVAFAELPDTMARLAAGEAALCRVVRYD